MDDNSNDDYHSLYAYHVPTYPAHHIQKLRSLEIIPGCLFRSPLLRYGTDAERKEVVCASPLASLCGSRGFLCCIITLETQESPVGGVWLVHDV